MAASSVPFARRLRDPKPEERLAALSDALKPGGPAATASEVAPLLDDPDLNVRQLAVALLGQLGAPALSALIQALNAKQPAPVRIFAASGLLRIGPAAATAAEPLGKCLTDSDEGVRLNAALALSRIGPAALPVLRRGLAAEGSAAASARGLGWMEHNGAAAAEDLKRVASAGPVGARAAASAALVRVTGDPAAGLPALVAVFSAGDQEPARRVDAIDRTGELQEKGRGAAAALRACLEGVSAPVRAAAALALARVGSVEPETATALTRKLKDPDTQVQAHAILALERIGPPAGPALPALRELSASKDPRVALVAAAAVRSIEGPPAGAAASPARAASAGAAGLSARSAAEVAARYPITPEAKALLKEGQSPRQFVDVLLEKRRYQDAIQFLAHALAKPEAVWWACVCAREAAGQHPSPEVATAIAAAEKWVSTQTDDSRLAALPAAQAAEVITAAGSAALAAFLSGGSLAPPQLPPQLPPENACAQLVSGAVLQSVYGCDPEKAPERLRAAALRGLEVAAGTNRWR